MTIADFVLRRATAVDYLFGGNLISEVARKEFIDVHIQKNWGTNCASRVGRFSAFLVFFVLSYF